MNEVDALADLVLSNANANPAALRVVLRPQLFEQLSERNEHMGFWSGPITTSEQPMVEL
jgi:hypothetical protein